MSIEREFPRYKCHKEVKAAKILFVIPHEGSGGAKLCFEDFPAITVDHLFMAKHNPSRGGYYVICDDGYKSFSPAKAFEEGYTLIEETK